VVGVTAAPAVFGDIEHLYCGSVFPGPQFFEDCETALCLFSAAWYGRQDAYWIAKHGMRGTCVDLDGDRLDEMARVYPTDWEFDAADVFYYAEGAVDSGLRWDVITLDPYTNLFEKCAAMLPTWCALANRVVVLGHGNYRLREPEAPEGWEQAARIKRSDFKGGIYWLVYRKTA
jgi:hypothetical protein